MIVTIDDFRGTANPGARLGNNQSLTEDDFKFTVARAGRIKLRLQALNNALVRTPLDQHNQLQLNDIIKSTSSRTYVDGSEEVYFMIKGLESPEDIPDIFVKAYSEVLQLRPFMNKYILKPFNKFERPRTIAARFAPTFSDVRPILPELDAVCDTALDEYFQKAEQKVKPFPFLRLPAELRLHVYDYLVPHSTYIRMSSRKYPKDEKSLPERLGIMRVSKKIHGEVTKHCFNQRILLFKACRIPQIGTTRECFTTQTAEDYAERIMSISPTVKHRLTRLEIQVLPTEESRHQSLRDSFMLADKISLRQICTSLPNLESILFSYPKPDPKSSALFQAMGARVLRYKEDSPYNHNRKVTLEWIREQMWLPVGGLRILWDLTYFRDSVQDARRLRQDMLSERMMRELLEENGKLELAQSATANRKDLQRWSEIRPVVLEAVGQQ